MAQTPRQTDVLPVGRYISGDHTRKRTTDMDGRPIPEAEQSFEFGVAVRKDAPGIMELLNRIYQFTAGCYAQNQDVLQRMTRGFVGTKQGGISWKIKDGDQPNAKGERDENAAGCFVFYFSTMYPIKAANAQNAEIDPAMIKRGFFVDVAFSYAPNMQVGDRAGIYLNPNIIRLVAFGTEIVGGLTAEQAFGAVAPTYLPPGATLAPPAPAGGMPGFPPATSPHQAGGFPPANGFPAHTTAAPATALPPNGFPATAPVAAYPSNQGFPGAVAPPPTTGGFPAAFPPPASAQPPTGYPINPATGQPVQPLPGFLHGAPPR